MTWTAEKLEKGYEKTIIGFDLRCREGVAGFDVPAEKLAYYFDLGSTEYPYTDETVKGMKIPAIMDISVWPRCLKDERFDVKYNFTGDGYTNEFGLFDMDNIEPPVTASSSKVTKMPPHFWLEIARNSDAVIVAFDMPACYPRVSSDASYTAAYDLISYDLVSRNKNWILLGYDVADFYVANSAMYTSKDAEEKHLEYAFTRQSIELNSYGILQTEADAIAISRAYDEVNPDHSPFSPCGVWIYKDRQG